MGLEEMLERQGLSQSEIESKVASFRSLLLRQLTNQATNNNKPEPLATPALEAPRPASVSSNKRRSHHEDKEEVRRHKKRKRKKESKPRKKKKEKRKSYCASPSYSDYEPENPILRRNLSQTRKSSEHLRG